jgi:tRNA U34 5-methylaminomethyl-2-thiouridine-forming methyltransferase MnmC
VKPRLILSEDGSHTLYVPELNEHYHSVHGAIQESLHVFINAGLRACSQKKLNILEIGFGTGLNAFLTFIEADKQNFELNYITYEPFALQTETWQQLNYPQLFNNPRDSEIFTLLHEAVWGIPVALGDNFVLHKRDEKIEDAILPEHFFNLIYFDAFAPAVQPELWTYQIFKKIFEATASDGILVTYSAMGEVRRNLIKAGFIVERIPGPPGKREMLRAIKKN